MDQQIFEWVEYKNVIINYFIIELDIYKIFECVEYKNIIINNSFFALNNHTIMEILWKTLI